MNPKEKAKELVEKFTPLAEGTVNDAALKEYDRIHGNGEVVKKSLRAVMRLSKSMKAKQCALICVDEKIQTAKGFTDWSPTIDFLEQVKQEIESL